MPANADRTFTAEMAGAVRAWFGIKNKRAGELAAALGVSRPTAADRYHGRTPYTNDEIDRVAEFLGISPFDIVQTAQQTSIPAPVVDAKPQVDVWAQPSRAKRKAS